MQGPVRLHRRRRRTPGLPSSTAIAVRHLALGAGDVGYGRDHRPHHFGVEVHVGEGGELDAAAWEPGGVAFGVVAVSHLAAVRSCNLIIEVLEKASLIASSY